MINHMKRTVLFVLASVLMLLPSCSSYKRIAYLQDMEVDKEYPVSKRVETKIRKDDRLNILVACKSPALAAPFNVATGSQQVDQITNEVKYAVAPEASKGYLVDENGNINFPVLGYLHVEGMTLTEVRNWIRDLIIQGDYIKEPIVNIEFTNFQYTLIGEIGSGTRTVNSGCINLFQAVADAGDLGYSAKRDEVWVIRTDGDTRKVYTVNLKSKDCFDSPAFYLQQNDLVYVKPYKSKADEFRNNTRSLITLMLSILSTASTCFYWFARY